MGPRTPPYLHMKSGLKAGMLRGSRAWPYYRPKWSSGSKRIHPPMIPMSHILPNQRMKLAWRGGRLKRNESILVAAAAPRSLCAIR